ncbi:NXPE family member 3-like [Haliotis asinina]|uniref:NXPE family member 3-like n=1 Tax=Haliotis asinina TaxID=109174 RepID=UPI003531C88E
MAAFCIIQSVRRSVLPELIMKIRIGIIYVFIGVTIWCGLCVVYVNRGSFKQSFLKITHFRLFRVLHRWPDVTNNDATTTGRLYLIEEILRKGSKFNVSETTDASRSSMYVKRKSSYRVGDLIQIQIDLYDSQGKRKKTGGDFLRVWMEDSKNSNSVSGQVFDHNNGSYTAVVKAVWVGQGTIRAFIATRREEILYRYKIFEKYASLWITYFVFRKDKLEETNGCSIRVPADEKSGNWCNFTMENNGFPWYCLKPKNKQLTCSMWTISFSGVAIAYKLNTSEDTVARWSSKDPKPDILQSPLNVFIASEDKTSTEAFSQVACNKLPPKLTWQRKSPNGYFLHGKWHSLLCTDKLPRTINAYRQCLKGRTLWLPGDSTSTQFKTSLHSFLKFKSHSRGHEPVIDTDSGYNFSISFHAHEFPFYHGHSRCSRSTNQAEDIILDHLPNTTKDIVVLYLYIHFSFVHPDVFRQHVRRLVPSAKNLLARAPNVTLAVRGPHAFFRSERGLLSYWGLLYADIWHEEFASLQDRIVYLDFWDFSMALELDNVHPPLNTVDKMVHHMMSLLCHRK